MLSVNGTKIVNEHGAPVQLRGMSMFWSQWMGPYWNADVVNWLVEDFQVNFVRAAMGVDQGGYMTDPDGEKAKLVRVVEACINAGIYVMIDWHDHEATEHVDAAVAFFDEMASTYGHLPNVLFETFNEPLDDDTVDNWDTALKPYHETVVPVIRQHTQNIITLGTRAWSQKVDEACQNPVSGSNLVYTLHFYAQIHYEELRQGAEAAMDRGCAIFISEWGTGFSILDLSSSKLWLDWADSHMLSNANWGVYDKEGEAVGALTWPQGNESNPGGWSMEDPSVSGRWVRTYLRGEGTTSAPSPAPLDGCCLSGDACMCGWCSDSLGRCLTCGGAENSSIPDTCGGNATMLSVQV